MAESDLIGLFIGPLERLGMGYMVTGGVAAVVYGDPRFTRDVDVVLELHAGDAQRLASAFAGGDFYVPPLDVLEDEASRGGHFNLIHRDTTLRADVYLVGTDPLHRWAFARRRRLPVGSSTIWLAPIEYVITRKLEYFVQSGSDRHLRDVAMMLHISADQVDEGELDRWVRRLDLGDALDRARCLPPS